MARNNQEPLAAKPPRHGEPCPGHPREIVPKTAYIQAGAGIVADSNPTAEYQETLNKARGLLKAIEITEQRAG